MDESLLLTIDLGTSGPKACIFTPGGDCLSYAFTDVSLQLSPGGGAEQDPAEWRSAIDRSVRACFAKVNQSVLDRIVGACVTSQWSGTVAVDSSGTPLRPAILWMDSRGAPHADRVTGGFPEFEGYNIRRAIRWVSRTGGIPSHSGKDSLAHILYIKHEEPEIYRRTHKFLEPKDYLNFWLTGKFAASYDSIALHWVTDNRNLDRVEYDPLLLRWAGVERERLPDLQPAASLLGPLRPELAREWGLRPGVELAMGTPDLQSAALGSGAVRDYEGHLYVGTSAWITCHTPQKKTDVLHNIAALPSAIPGRYLAANEQESAGQCLKFLRDQIVFDDDGLGEPAPADAVQHFDRLAAASPPGARGLLFTPWLYGERTPVEDHRIRGGLIGLGLEHRRGDVVRAVFEGVALNARWLLQYLERFVGRPFAHLNMIGGGANSPVWAQIFADVLDRPVRQIADPIQANSRGAAFLAAAALGLRSWEEIARDVRVAASFRPEPANRALYAGRFQELLLMYKIQRGYAARLHGSKRR